MPPKKQAPKPINLNSEQEVVVSLRSGHYSVMAGPGSGKTAVLVERYSQLINEGVSPDQILSLSFTSSAAKNLRDRVEAKVGKLSGKRTSGALTFHSLGLSFTTQEAHEFPFKLAEFPLCPEPVALKLSGEAARRYEIDPRTLRPYISLQKRRRVNFSDAIKATEISGRDIKLALAYKDYQRRLRESETLDFDSLLYEMVELLEKKPDVRQRWLYDFCQIDESQDCCGLEWKLIELLSTGSLLAVGDAGQGVYGFRGSDPKLFLNMDQMFSGTKKFYLAQNYRSTSSLVDFLKTIGPVPDLAEKFHTSNDLGVPPEIFGFASPHDEANFVVNKIKEGL